MAPGSREGIKAELLSRYSLLKQIRVPQCQVVGKMTAREEGTLCQNSYQAKFVHLEYSLAAVMYLGLMPLLKRWSIAQSRSAFAYWACAKDGPGSRIWTPRAAMTNYCFARMSQGPGAPII